MKKERHSVIQYFINVGINIAVYGTLLGIAFGLAAMCGQ